MTGYNMVVRCDSDKSFLIDLRSAMATKLSESRFKAVVAANPDRFAGYRFVPAKDVDFSWWHRVDKLLTASKIVSGVAFDCDCWGNVIWY